VSHRLRSFAPRVSSKMTFQLTCFSYISSSTVLPTKTPHHAWSMGQKNGSCPRARMRARAARLNSPSVMLGTSTGLSTARHPTPAPSTIHTRTQTSSVPSENQLETMPALQILSDLHLEAPPHYNNYPIPPAAAYLALLGDIGTPGPHTAEFLSFLRIQLKQFRAVLFVPGNHEAYHSTWETVLSTLRAFASEIASDSDPSLGEFILLDRGVFRVPESRTVILGCSLFSNVPEERVVEVSQRLNDFYVISDWDVEKHNAAHARDVTWLNEQVAALEVEDVEIMVLSHWGPSRDEKATEPRHVGSTIQSAFTTDLVGEVCFKSDKVKVWAFGHTHYNCDFEVQREGAGPLRIVTNQRGYYHTQAMGYDVKKAIQMN